MAKTSLLLKNIVKLLERYCQSYESYGDFNNPWLQGAQLFEAVGLSDSVVNKYFTGTVTRIGGLSLDQIEKEYLQRMEDAFGPRRGDYLQSGGIYQFKVDGEYHLFNPHTIIISNKLFVKGTTNSLKNTQLNWTKKHCQRRQHFVLFGNLNLTVQKFDLSEVEPVETIVKRFKVGAMSFGSLSKEAHETIAEAMNSIGAKSNSGEGGENRNRFKVQPDGRNLNSKIKQSCFWTFGVNAEYLMSAEELQIKISTRCETW